MLPLYRIKGSPADAMSLRAWVSLALSGVLLAVLSRPIVIGLRFIRELGDRIDAGLAEFPDDAGEVGEGLAWLQTGLIIAGVVLLVWGMWMSVKVCRRMKAAEEERRSPPVEGWDMHEDRFNQEEE